MVQPTTGLDWAERLGGGSGALGRSRALLSWGAGRRGRLWAQASSPRKGPSVWRGGACLGSSRLLSPFPLVWPLPSDQPCSQTHLPTSGKERTEELGVWEEGTQTCPQIIKGGDRRPRAPSKRTEAERPTLGSVRLAGRTTALRWQTCGQMGPDAGRCAVGGQRAGRGQPGLLVLPGAHGGAGRRCPLSGGEM